MYRALFVFVFILNCLPGPSQSTLHLTLTSPAGKIPKKIVFSFSDSTGKTIITRPANPSKGKYVFANIPAGYNALTVAPKGYYATGLQWWTQLPDSAALALQSCRRDYEYKNSAQEITTMQLADNLVWIKFKPGTGEAHRNKVLGSAGLTQSKWTNTYTVPRGSLLQPFNNSWLETIRKDTCVEECGPVAWITGTKAVGAKTAGVIKPARFTVVSNTITLQFDETFCNLEAEAKKDYLEQLFQKYRLSQDALQRAFNRVPPVFAGDMLTLDCAGGIGTGIFSLAEQLRKEKYVKAANVHFISP